MTVRLHALLLVMGGLLVAVGAVLGFTPLSANGADCGSAFVKSDNPLASDFANAMIGSGPLDTVATCDDTRSARRGVALALLIPGVIAGAAGGLFWLTDSNRLAGERNRADTAERLARYREAQAARSTSEAPPHD